MLRSNLTLRTLEQKNNVAIIGGFIPQNSDLYTAGSEWNNLGKLLLVLKYDNKS